MKLHWFFVLDRNPFGNSGTWCFPPDIPWELEIAARGQLAIFVCQATYKYRKAAMKCWNVNNARPVVPTRPHTLAPALASAPAPADRKLVNKIAIIMKLNSFVLKIVWGHNKGRVKKAWIWLRKCWEWRPMRIKTKKVVTIHLMVGLADLNTVFCNGRQ